MVKGEGREEEVNEKGRRTEERTKKEKRRRKEEGKRGEELQEVGGGREIERNDTDRKKGRN